MELHSTITGMIPAGEEQGLVAGIRGRCASLPYFDELDFSLGDTLVRHPLIFVTR